MAHFIFGQKKITVTWLSLGARVFGIPIRKMITTRGGTVGNSEEEGISLTIPPGALSPDESSEFEIQLCITCPLKLPDGYGPASPVYFIRHKKGVQFQQNITVKLLHYIDLESLDDPNSNLVFMTATRDTKGKYLFKKIEDSEGSFEADSQVGKIELSHFSPVMIAQRQDETDQRGIYTWYRDQLWCISF